MGSLRAAVVGGGIIGAATARKLAMHGADVTLFEKEPRLAAHQTGHNSGVVHAGLYYPPGSLKARLCRRGVQLLAEFTAARGLPYEECGKLVVALDDSELDRLDAIHDRAVANGVPGIRRIGPDEITDIEPHARGIAALHSPHTAIVDYVAVTTALADDVTAAGGTVRLATPVTAIRSLGDEVLVGTDTGTDGFDLVITCAGLQSDRLAHGAGDLATPAIVPFLGDYHLLRPEAAGRVRGLIYPVPDPRYPFLGVHLTKRIDGAIMVGPNAFLAPGREAYRRRSGSLRDLRDALVFPGFRHFAVHNVPAATRELRTAVSIRRFVAEAAKYVPGLTVADVLPGPRGIRAQAMEADGSLVDDFVITGHGRVVHLRNAPSPGATSSMAIAEHLVGAALERAGLQA
ncbi:L-2-hydroxyglutarate oxidase [Rhodococcus aetherivorans]|uniref:L-2-hydroxyglutarate oxidase n=1 Tax=Rhodococcus aetherivorans TaxID=191292 RepID=A0ABQ0YR71_9NOCA|nr:L-2-hydroxyglutarate oxidase [Rhodococcus aetherivorans]ETT27808.1 FAD dependent oxidoreductase [Rhodococcus rhodochrous ATCC 21198]NGP26077.1 L-2-hydroxyglutarate oxidase [Rhodococcus aetherivorans]GES38983.1 L-2-hydroxyglutarate oxidase [Rhodococcus aetherivorans]